MKRQPKPRAQPLLQTATTAQNSAEVSTPAKSLFDSLLVQQAAPQQRNDLIHGVVVATLLELLPDGKVRLALPDHGFTALCATPVCALQVLHEGAQVAVMFEQGNTSRALVLGPMAASPATQFPEDLPVREALIDDERIVIEAEQEIELRCGDAAIILTRDGRILLRGTDITSHASVTQRIRGGSVQIN